MCLLSNRKIHSFYHERCFFYSFWFQNFKITMKLIGVCWIIHWIVNTFSNPKNAFLFITKFAILFVSFSSEYLQMLIMCIYFAVTFNYGVAKLAYSLYKTYLVMHKVGILYSIQTKIGHFYLVSSFKKDSFSGFLFVSNLPLK